MNTRDAQTRMHEVEQHGHDFNVEQYVQWLLGLADDPDDVGVVVNEEAERAIELAGGYYERVTQRVALLHPQMLAVVAFIQGATFAAAALGHEPGSQADVE